MRLIPLTQGKFAMVDDADFDAVNAHKWCAHKIGRRFYAMRAIRKPDGTKWIQHLHTFLLPDAGRVDHRDGDGLNNQRYNLRPATYTQNARGFKRKRARATSQYRGVSWHKKLRKWEACIMVNKKVPLGYFHDETDAAHAYDAAAVFYFGEWASTNFPIGDITIS